MKFSINQFTIDKNMIGITQQNSGIQKKTKTGTRKSIFINYGYNIWLQQNNTAAGFGESKMIIKMGHFIPNMPDTRYC